MEALKLAGMFAAIGGGFWIYYWALAARGSGAF